MAGNGATAERSPHEIVGDKQKLFASIGQHQAWEALGRHYAEMRGRQEQAWGRKLMGGEPLDQREVDYLRGFWHGVAAILASPAAAEKAIERDRVKRALRGEEDDQ